MGRQKNCANPFRFDQDERLRAHHPTPPKLARLLPQDTLAKMKAFTLAR